LSPAHADKTTVSIKSSAINSENFFINFSPCN
jgi:hypothetical protein